MGLNCLPSSFRHLLTPFPPRRRIGTQRLPRSCLQPLMCVNRLTFQDLDMCHGGSRVCNVFYQFEASLLQRDDAHSIVPGGFDVMS